MKQIVQNCTSLAEKIKAEINAKLEKQKKKTEERRKTLSEKKNVLKQKAKDNAARIRANVQANQDQILYTQQLRALLNYLIKYNSNISDNLKKTD